jgi:hypothetical protein
MERQDLHDPIIRERLLPSHPIVNKPYTILTPMIDQTYRIMRERVWLRRTGSYMHAQPRMGKTICAHEISRLLQLEFPTILLAEFSADGGKSDVSFVKDLADDALKIKLEKRPNYNESVSKVLAFIRAECELRKGNQFILVVDEMQTLRENDYRVLMNIHNRLELAGVMMTTLGFAQPEINQQRSALLATSAHNIIARFLSEPIPFAGCTNCDGLRYILKGYDNEKTFPPQSHWTFTRFFIPKAYDSGFRLSTHAEAIWRSLKNAAAALNTGSVPMEHLTRVVEAILLAGRMRDMANFELSITDIEEAIDSSNLLTYATSMNDGS